LRRKKRRSNLNQKDLRKNASKKKNKGKPLLIERDSSRRRNRKRLIRPLKKQRRSLS
jgi:hypothetical protein